MDRNPSRTRPAVGLAVVSLVGLVTLTLVGNGHVGGLPLSRIWMVASASWGAWIVHRHGRGWPAASATVLLLLLMAAGALGYLLLHGTAIEGAPSAWDAAYLLFLIPIGLIGRDEYAAHFERMQRADTALDVALLALGATALAYPFARPIGADAAASIAAFTFLLIAAAIVSVFAALTLWVPTRAHVLQLLAYTPVAVVVATFGIQRAHGTFDDEHAVLNAVWFAAPLAIAATLTLVAHVKGRAPSRFARPILSSVAAVTACTALVVVALFDAARDIAGAQATALFVAIALLLVARIVWDRLTASEMHAADRSELSEREAALVDADRSLERVRETNEVLRRSEEHLRLVFEAAVDGFVELDEDGTILRANQAFADMLRVDRLAIEGQRWNAVAASIDGADEGFARLFEGGAATIERTDGGPLHLESRVSSIPTDPPRTLMLVRDVTASKVSEQTIRSLFQFLQDRDEDRTRLLRRTNAAIEQERNRIARDLHDGPVQGVSAASLSLEAALLMIKAGDVERGLEVLTTLRGEIASEAEGLRRLMASLRPPVLEERGLLPALRETLTRFGVEHELATDFVGSVREPMAEDLETLAYRIVQEALANVAKHAHAAHVTVRVETDAQQLRVEVDDDGEGFDTAMSREFLHAGRVGLASMREHVELASGTFAVRSMPGRGTTVMATIPLDATLALGAPSPDEDPSPATASP
jgi:PAS domain S-box-containing protein